MYVFVNGHILAEQDAVISVFDHGFLYGFGLFETMRSYQGKLFLYNQHYERLTKSARQYQIAIDKSEEELYHDIQATMKANGLQDAYIRVTVTGGRQGLGLYGGEHENPSWIIMAKPVPSPPSKTSLHLLKTRRSSPETAFRAKSLSFANNVLAKKEMANQGKDSWEGVFVNDNDEIVEGIVSNVFFVQGNTVYTPHEDTGLLPGVTRGMVIHLCHQLGLEVREGFYRFGDLQGMEEAFITNSIQEIVPVECLDQMVFSTIPGKITSQLMARYREAVFNS